MTKHETLSVRIPKSLHVALKRRERETDVPMSRFVRKVLLEALNRTGFEHDLELAILDGEVKEQ
jgi:hypothetical protein